MTEKTHFGTLVEINLQREFSFADGKAMNCKFSQKLAGQAAWPPR